MYILASWYILASMSGYSSGFGGSGGTGVDYGASQEKGRVMEQVRSQIAVANLQEMIIVSVSRVLLESLLVPLHFLRKCLTSVSGNVLGLRVQLWTAVSRYV